MMRIRTMPEIPFGQARQLGETTMNSRLCKVASVALMGTLTLYGLEMLAQGQTASPTASSGGSRTSSSGSGSGTSLTGSGGMSGSNTASFSGGDAQASFSGTSTAPKTSRSGSGST